MYMHSQKVQVYSIVSVMGCIKVSASTAHSLDSVILRLVFCLAARAHDVSDSLTACSSTHQQFSRSWDISIHGCLAHATI